MKGKGDRPLTGLIALIAAAGIGLLALLVLAPDYAQAGLNGARPGSMQSARQADYSADPLDQARIQPVNMRAVQQYLADQADPSQPAAAQAASLSNRLKTPVATVTPNGPGTKAAPAPVPGAGSTPPPNATAASITPQPSATETSLPAEATATPVRFSATPTLRFTTRPTSTLAARSTATRLPPPSATPTPGFVTAIPATRTAAPAATATKIPPTLPAYPPPKPTATTKPYP